MIHIVFLFYILSLCTGLSLFLVMILLRLRARIPFLKYYLLLHLVLILNTVSIIVSFYRSSIIVGSMHPLFRIPYQFFIMFVVGLVILSLFFYIHRVFKLNLAGVKKFVFGFLAFLTPQFLFSSTLFREFFMTVEQHGMEINPLSILAFLSVLFTSLFIAGSIRKTVNREKNRVLKGILVFLCFLLLFMLFDYFLFCKASTFFQSDFTISFTVIGYFIFCGAHLLIIYFTNITEGLIWFTPAIYLFDQYGISKREIEVIRLLLKGHSNREIGEKLFISLSTVKSHIYSIYQKMNIRSRMQLMRVLQNDTFRFHIESRS